jgi:uncharacterized protein (TIGR02001 family)
MKRFAFSAILAASLISSGAFAADIAVKAPPAPAPAPPPPAWDFVITTALMNDYNFRGITQSNHRPSVQGGFEARYNFDPNWQGYLGVSGESISFPNQPAAEIDFYGGIRPTFGKLALDFGAWDYYYPGGKCFNPVVTACSGSFGGDFVPGTQFFPLGGNVAKANASFFEAYAKGVYTVNDNLSLGLQEWYSPSVVNLGAWGWYTVGNVTITLPSAWFAAWPISGLGGYISADGGYWDLGTSDAFYGDIKYTSYWNWDAGIGFTYKVLTLDLRYYDSNLSKSECNAFTSAQSVSFSQGFITAQNPNGLGTNWCGAAFIAKLSATIDFNKDLK